MTMLQKLATYLCTILLIDVISICTVTLGFGGSNMLTSQYYHVMYLGTLDPVPLRLHVNRWVFS